MGTRSVTNVVDTKGDNYVSMYRQYDGYPKGGHGQELAEFLVGARIGNGIGGSDGSDPKFFNGVGDLAIRLVSHFKPENTAGSFYLIPQGTDWSPDYTYTVFAQEGRRVGVRVESFGSHLFEGNVEEFIVWMDSEEDY